MSLASGFGEFSGFVPRYVLDHLGTTTLIEPADLAVADAGLLFVDIIGSTSIGEQLASHGPGGAEEMARRLNEFFSSIIEVIHRHGGDITGFAGDSLMAYWTGTSAVPIDAALAVQQRVRSIDVAAEQFAVRLSIGEGSLRRLVLGGHGDRWHVVVAGTALADAGTANARARPDEVVVSAAVAARHPAASIGEHLDDGCVRLEPRSVSPASVSRPSIDRTIDRSLLRSFVPAPVLAHFDDGQQEWLAESRVVTVIFAGLPDLGADTPLAIAQRLIEGAQRQVLRVDATLNKVSCDDKGIAIVAALGMPPRAHEHDPERGARLALALEAEARAAGTRCYVGVATGRVFCGTVGNDERREYTMMGTAVNRAARLMSHAMTLDPSGAVVADQPTATAVLDGIEQRSLPMVTLKGIGAISPSRLLAVRDQRPSRATTSLTAAVGRADDVARLQRAITGWTNGPAPIAVITGEPGIGKSSLAADGVRAAEAADVRVLVAAGEAIERATPFAPIRTLIRQLLDVSVDDLDGTRRHILERLGPELASQAALLGDVLPVAFEPTEQTMILPADAGAGIVQSLVAATLERLTTDRPTLVCLEDLQWFDAASVAVVATVAASRRVAMLLTARSGEFRGGELDEIAHQPDALEFVLGPLGREAVAHIIAGTLQARRADDQLVDAVVQRGGGHPLFAQELARAMMDQHLLVVDDDGIVGPRPRVSLDETSFPDSLDGIIGQRIDRLPSADQVTLRAASVVGVAFELEPLGAIHRGDGGPDALVRSLHVLVDQGLLLHDMNGYRFVHALTRDVAHDRLLFSQKATLHSSIAEWYASNTDDRAAVGRLAHHWEQSWLAATAIERPPVDLAHVQARAADALEQATNGAIASGLLHQAVELGLRATHVLGVELPTDPVLIGPAIGAAMQRIGELAGANEPEQLLDLPALANSDIERAVLLILRIQPSVAMIQDRDLFALLALRNYGLVLEHGLGMGAPGAIAVFGSLEQLMSGDSARAHHRTSIALDIARRQGGMMLSYVSFVHSWLVNHWYRPIAEIIDLAKAGSRAGFESGDVVFGSFNAASAVVSAAIMGMPLDELTSLAEHYEAEIAGRVHSAAFHCRHERQFARALAGATTHPRSMTDDRYDETLDLASILDTPSLNQSAAYHSSKARLDYLYRDYAGALAHADRAVPILDSMAGQLLETEFVFVHALALLQRSAQPDHSDPGALRARAATLTARLEVWTASCPCNFDHKLAAVVGVETWVDGDPAGGADILDGAAISAAQNGFVQHEALAHELAAQARQAAGDRTGARASAAASIDAYRRWGATAKVTDVMSQFADL